MGTWKPTEANTSRRVCVRCAQRSLRVMLRSWGLVDGDLSSLFLGLPKTVNREINLREEPSPPRPLSHPYQQKLVSECPSSSVGRACPVWTGFPRWDQRDGDHLLTASELRTEKTTGANGGQFGTDKSGRGRLGPKVGKDWSQGSGRQALVGWKPTMDMCVV